jgi:tetratricopeptide (TPR) repeat protein
MENKENHNNTIARFQNNFLTTANKNFAITNKLINSEISSLFNQGFCKLNSRIIKNSEKDYLFELNHSTNQMIVKNFEFKAENRYDYEQAVNYFQQVIKLKPNHSLTYSMLGILYINWSNCNVSNDSYGALKWGRNALDALNRAIEIDPRNALAFYFRVELEEQGLHNKPKNKTNRHVAIDSLTNAIEIDSKFSQAYHYRACIKTCILDDYGSDNKNYQEAMDDFDKAISLDYSYATAYARRGALKRKLKDYQGAIIDFSNAIKYNSKIKTNLIRQRGEMRLMLGDIEGAQNDFDLSKKSHK